MSGARQALIRLGTGLLVAAVFLLLLEGVLRLLPLARWEGGQSNLSNPLFIPGAGEYAGKFITNPHFQSSMSFHSFAKVKPSAVKRIFVLGGSAALGWPGPNQSSFSGYLQRALEKAAPGGYEVISVAAMSYGSHRVLDLLHDVVEMEPDAVIIWSGNNEYIERNVFSPYARSAAMGRVQRALRHSSLYRSLRMVLQATVPALFVHTQGADITNPRKLPQVRRGRMGRSAEADRQVLENYRANFQTMAALIKESGATGIFCTVPVNLSGWAPSDALPEFDDALQAAQWEALLQQALVRWEQGKFAEVVPLLRQMLEMTPRYAVGHYLLGNCYQRLGRIEEAKTAYNLARDLDPRPLRSLTVFAEVVREIAAAGGMRLVDLEREFIRWSGGELSGQELFLDYVHPTEAGNKLAATLLLAELLPGIKSPLPVGPLAQSIREDDWFSQNFVWKSGFYYALGMTFQNNGDMERAEQAYRQSLKEDPRFPEPKVNLGAIYELRGDLVTARSYYEEVVRADPWATVAGDLARILYLQGDREGARAMGQRIVDQGVVNFDLFELLGDIESDAGRAQTAIGFYRQALDAGGEGHELLIKLGNAYQRAGDHANARAILEQAKSGQ